MTSPLGRQSVNVVREEPLFTVRTILSRVTVRVIYRRVLDWMTGFFDTLYTPVGTRGRRGPVSVLHFMLSAVRSEAAVNKSVKLPIMQWTIGIRFLSGEWYFYFHHHARNAEANVTCTWGSFTEGRSHFRPVKQKHRKFYPEISS
jgi:hypothetical protein